MEELAQLRQLLVAGNTIEAIALIDELEEMSRTNKAEQSNHKSSRAVRGICCDRNSVLNGCKTKSSKFLYYRI